MTRLIFHDPSGRRARQVSLAGWTISIVSSLLCVAFIASLFVVPTLPGLTFNTDRKTAVPINHLAVPGLADIAARLAAETRARQANVPRAIYPAAIKIAAPPRVLHPAAARQAPLTIGFYANWDDNSYSSLKHRLNNLDWVVPTWLTIAA